MFEQLSAEEAIIEFQTSKTNGLSKKEANKRLKEDGPNVLQEAKKSTVAENFFKQMKDPLIYVLLAAALVSVLLQEISDAVIIGFVVLTNAFIGMIQEGKAMRALEALKKLESPKATVLRDGVRQEIPAANLVFGDIVYLEAGGIVPADLRLLESVQLKTDESTLTGESLPVEKDADFLIGKGIKTTVADRHNMVYMSTMITNGRGVGVVVATGMQTQIGQIAKLMQQEKEEQTPLQNKLAELGKVLSFLSVALCVALFLVAVIQRRNVGEMLITAISLAVAAVPEGLPAVVTICLALSVTRMVKVHTIIRRLPSVETLGAVTVVCSDKTGTLTQNKMTVEQYITGEKNIDEADYFLQGMVLCNDAVYNVKEENGLGDPTELALLAFAEKVGYRKEEWERMRPRMQELAFDSDRKMMTTFHKGRISFSKGAPDVILGKCSEIRTNGKRVRLTKEKREQIQENIATMTQRALRILAIAMKEGVEKPEEEDLIFLGLVGLADPIRQGAAEAVETFKKAGVRTVMITGDHIDTAFEIGKKLGIVRKRDECMTGSEIEEYSEAAFAQKIGGIHVFARVTPAQKVQIVNGFQRRGEVVAMTGDGVNDAPSLKRADIGIAMGKNGTDVAKQAADMVLTDDHFATIEKAIAEGRGVYENIRKSVIFLLSSNMGEIGTMFVAVLLGLASPLKSSHILWINLITDSLPAFALGVDKNDTEELMQFSPRGKKEGLFARGGLICTCFYGFLIATASLGAFLLLPCVMIRGAGECVTIEGLKKVLTESPQLLEKAQTYAFTVLAMSQLFHAVGMRDTGKSVFRMKHTENKLMIVSCVLGFLLQYAVTEIPFLIGVFGTSKLMLCEWLHLSVLAATPLIAHELLLLGGRKRRKR